MSLDDPFFLAKLSCYDFRLEYEKLGLSKWSLYKRFIPWLKQKFTFHLSYLRPIGVSHVFATISDRERWRYYRNKYVGRTSLKIREMNDFPLSRYIHKLYLFGDGTVGVLYYAPREIMDEMLARLDSFYEEVREAKVYPVMNCHGKLWPEIGPEEAEKMGREALTRLNSIEEYHSRNRFLDYMILSVMEYRPELTLKELSNIVHAVDARIERELGEEAEISIKYVRRHYQELSKRYVIGRIFVMKPAIYTTYFVEGEYRELLYGLAATTMGAVHYVDLGDTAMASLAIRRLEDNVSFIFILSRGILKSMTNIIVYTNPFPFEMYNPLEDSWSLDKPVIENLAEIVKKYRLAKITR